MKKILIATNIALLCIIYFGFIYGCNSHQPETPDITETQHGPYSADSCKICKEYNNISIPGLVSVETAIKMSRDYKNDRGKTYIWLNNSENTQIEDASSIRFDLEQLKNYIWKIENAFCRNRCHDQNLGIRFYYGKYPDTAATENLGLPANYAFRHSVFMIGTYLANGKHIDFDPSFTGNDPCKPVSFTEALKNPQYNGLATILAVPALDGDADNHGGLMPPPAGYGNFGAGDY